MGNPTIDLENSHLSSMKATALMGNLSERLERVSPPRKPPLPLPKPSSSKVASATCLDDLYGRSVNRGLGKASRNAETILVEPIIATRKRLRGTNYVKGGPHGDSYRKFGALHGE